ncbi:unnamed protein product [Meloidogyne enterolobii]|uniref:Uncharacterized protein n=1 Tax=Meloidogyne enterolobii TaxID=390850 RepID=A0ACB0ZK03_MELEN
MIARNNSFSLKDCVNKYLKNKNLDYNIIKYKIFIHGRGEGEEDSFLKNE